MIQSFVLQSLTIDDSIEHEDTKRRTATTNQKEQALAMLVTSLVKGRDAPEYLERYNNYTKKSN